MREQGTTESRRDRWLSVLLSILVHAAIVGALLWGWWTYRAPRPAPRQLAIEATVVTDRIATAAPAPAAAPAAPPVTPAPPVAPPPEVAPAVERETQAQAQAQARREQRQQDKEAAAKARAAREAEAARQAEAAEEARKAQEARDAEAAQAAKAAEEAAHKAAVAKAALAKAALEAARAKRESELRNQLAAEERINAARASADETAWLALVRDRVTRTWIRPPSARAGVDCEVHVTQVPGGAVTGVQIGRCNGDDAVRESIEAAVYRASPLPSPSNPDLFDRNLKFNFHPDE